MSYSVYKHTFPNGKVYIGITRQKPEQRWRNGNGYIRKNKNGEYVQPLIAKAILKYNWNDIQHEILYQNLSREEAEKLEIELINKYKSNNVEFGYNTANGGNTTGTVSEITKEKIRKANQGKQIPEETKKKIGNTLKGRKLSEEHVQKMIGRKPSKETREKLSKASTGRKHSEITKEKLREMNKGENHPNYGKNLSEEHKKNISNALSGQNNPNYGKSMSEEQRKRISEANKGKVRSDDFKKKVSESMKGRKHSEESKRKMSEAQKNKKIIRCVETNKVYTSITSAERETGIARSMISNVCSGKQKTAGGYHWKFIDKEAS